MNNLIIRKALVTDAQTIANFQVAMAMETEKLHLNQQTVGNGVRAVFNDASKGCYFVAETNGEVIASLLITYEWSDWRNALIYWIQSVYVVPDYRRQGVFAKLYEYIKMQVLEDADVAGIRLYVDKSNQRALKVYENAGMNGAHYATYEWMKDF